MNPTISKFKKFLLPAILVLVALVVLLITWKWKDMSNQQAALYNTNAIQSACMIQIGSNGLPIPGTPSVRVISPNGGETYYSGQTIVVKWSKCSIPSGTVGSLVLTRLNGTGPVTYGPYAITTAQSTYSIQIPTLPGVYNGTNGIQSMYRATVTYGAVTDNSDNIFTIEKTPIGVMFDFGPNTGAWAANGQSQASLWVQFPLRAVGADMYLDKDVLLNTAASVLGGQHVTMKEYITVPGSGVVGAQTSFDAQVTTPPTLAVVTPNITLLPGGTYKIPVGQEVIFKIYAAVHVPVGATAPYHRALSLEWKQFGLAISDINGTFIEPNYAGPSVPVAYLDLW